MVRLTDIVPFPWDAESNAFFAALASALLPALGYTEETPFFCSPKGAYCIHCGGCGESATLQKHHLSLYHDYQTLTGVSLGWVWPEQGDVAWQTIEGGGPGWDWPDEFLALIMRAAGLTWRRLSGNMTELEIYQAVEASLEKGFPVLARLEKGTNWQLITGCADGVLGGLAPFGRQLGDVSRLGDEADTYWMPDWYVRFEDALVITGRCPVTVTLEEILTRLIHTLEHPAHERLERHLMCRLEQVTAANALETAEWLNQVASFPIEARWHAAEAFCSPVSTIQRLTPNRDLQQKLSDLFFYSYIADNHEETHGVCWKIWGLLGVGPETGFALGNQAAQNVQQPDVREELKRLFAIVFARDRQVLAGLRDILSSLGAS